MPSIYLQTALAAARAAEPIIMHHYSNSVAHELKADGSPVTAADIAAEEIIRETINARFPDHAILGEEFGQTGDSEFIWIIDPIDGTKNFMTGIPIFGTQIALMKNGELILGVSNCPALGELAHGEKGSGAFLNDLPIHVSDVSELFKASISIAGQNHFRKLGREEGMLRVINAARRVRGFGDCWAYHLIASGRFDADLEAPIKIWDIAAATAIITAAGGRCTDFDSQPITLDVRSFVASNGRIHDEILSMLS